MTHVRISGVPDFAELGQRWRELEARADCSFFQTWTWVGCLAAQRFPNPVLVEATEANRTVAMALFNRSPRRLAGRPLYLAESGTPALDCPYIEQNGVLTQAGRVPELTALVLRAVTRRSAVALSGIGDVTLAAAQLAARQLWVRRSQASPIVDLAALRRAGGDYLAARSANTRQQLRRSDRSYQREGPIVVRQAASVQEAWSDLDAMEEMHQAAWSARGKPGSFATPFFGAFHRELLRTAMPRQEATLLRVRGGAGVIGILYNFTFRGRVSAYQSGLNYAAGDPHAKPGLTCHHAAIRAALTQGQDVYDFLAGDDRYKRSLSDAEHTQHWAEAGPIWSPTLLLHRVRAHLAE